ncbi:T9SS type A sorting domain-containing protein [Rhodohalobacter sp. 8-1]|uniref:T9SS type A sorting domain-containing protein n=1 Tax=Rhodohalobacter sp. 8-1 TaxID=3131972 RepID=UPI0030EEE449
MKSLNLSPRVSILVALLTLLFHSGYAQLPQDYQYQVELRNYMASLSESDFNIEITGLNYQDVNILPEDELFKTWILRINRGRSHPSFEGITRRARYFTLEEIERDGAVYMDIGRGEFHDPIATAWWANWDFSGNPYYNSRAIKLRAAITVMVDMIMLERYHAEGKGRRSDFAGTSLLRMGYVYGIVKDVLPNSVRQAYEEGMVRLMSRIEDWGPTLIHADMDMFAVAGVWAVAESMDSNDMRQRARDYVSRLFDGAYRDAGYIHHGGGFDPSYQGITFAFVGWAAMISKDPFLLEKMEEMSRLKAYLSFPDPDGKWHGPSNFATSNDAGSPNDQWGPYHRDIGISMLTDEAKYLIGSGKDRPHWYMVGIPEPWELQEITISDLRRISDRIILDGKSDREPAVWSEDHWTNIINFAQEYYIDGFYQELKDLKSKDSPLLKAPLERSENYTENFGDELLIAKRDSFALAIHTGPLSYWGDETNISGLGGGGVSTFWTVETGPVILGKQRGFQNNSTGPDRWEDWELWPVHAISGTTENGKPFSSARQRLPESTFETNDSTISVRVSGVLNDRYAAPDNALQGEVTYRRKFEVGNNGLLVESSLMSDGIDNFKKLYEIVPIFIGNRQEIGVNIFFRSQKSDWIEATAQLQYEIDQVRIDRFNGSIYIKFDQPQAVRLSPEIWSTDYQTRSEARNIMIDLTGVNEIGEYKISYSISTEEKFIFKNSNEDSSGKDNNDSIGTSTNEYSENVRGNELKQNYPNPFNPTTEIQFELKEPQQVSLTVYDLTGRKIKTLADKFHSRGIHSVTFKADNLASGIYLYRLVTESSTQIIKRMTLIK